MRIALCITGLKRAGAESQVVRVADVLAGGGHSVLLMFLSGDAVILPENPAVSVRGLRLRKGPGSILPSALRAFLRARKELTAFAPDVVHSHLFHSNLFCRLLRLFVPMPRLVCSAHSTREKSPFRSFCYRITDPLGDLFTNVSDTALAASVASGAARARKARTLHNGVPTELFAYDAAARAEIRESAGLSAGDFLFLAAGRLIPAKDYPTLLEAFSRVLALRPDVRLWIAGEGPLRAELEKRAERLGLSRKVDFLGLRQDAPKLFSAADAFVLSSAYEGFGLVAAEAMAARCPVVATDCGGTAELLGDTGRLVPAGNPAALADAMARSIGASATERSEALDKAEARVASLFSIERSAAAWLAAYRNGGSE